MPISLRPWKKNNCSGNRGGLELPYIVQAPSPRYPSCSTFPQDQPLPKPLFLHRRVHRSLSQKWQKGGEAARREPTRLHWPSRFLVTGACQCGCTTHHPGCGLGRPESLDEVANDMERLTCGIEGFGSAGMRSWEEVQLCAMREENSWTVVK